MIQSYSLNLRPNYGSVIVPCSQYDTTLREIQFTIYNGSAIYSIPDNSVVTLRGTKPQDNTGFEYECSYSGSVVTFALQPQVTVYDGKIPAELRITKDGAIIGTANFVFNVEKSALDSNVVISDTDLPLLQEAINSVDTVLSYRNEAEQSAEDSQGYSEDSEAWAVGERGGVEVESTDETYHNNSKYYSELADTYSQNASSYATNASNSATEASGYADDAQSSATQAQGYAEASSDSADEASVSAFNASNSEHNASVSATSASDSATSAQTYANNASNSALSASQSATQAQGFASNASTSATNAQTYANNAYNSATTASQKASEASQSATNASNSATQAQGFASNASTYADNASASADRSESYVEDAEAWAVGQRGGVDVSSTDVTYRNNAKYYTNAIIDLMLSNNFSWSLLKSLIRSGEFSKWFKVGDQISDTWKEVSTGTEFTVPWDVVHIDDDGNAYFQWEFATPTGVPFDAPEAIYYFDGTESAGTYEIVIGSAYGTGWVVNQIIAFTLTSAPAENDQFVISLGENNANNPIGRTWNVYAKGSTVSKQSGTTFAGDGTHTSLGTIGLESAQKPNGRLNAIARAVYGSNRWSQSAIRQYLNSDSVKGTWWSAQNEWDRPVAVATTLDGFLYNFSDDFKSTLEEVEVVTALNTQEGYSDTTETTLDKIFLPSLQEMYINPQLANVEGVDWDYYKNLALESGLSGKFAQGGTYPVLISYNLASQASPVNVRLRSANRYVAGGTWDVNTSGSVNTGTAYYAHRPRPACKFLASI